MRKPVGAYIHVHPNTTDASGVFYVGKGSRLRARVATQRSERHRAELQKCANYPDIGFIECSTDAIALELEKGLIKILRRMGAPLANVTSGGEGCTFEGDQANLRERMAADKRGDLNPMKRPEIVAKVKPHLSARMASRNPSSRPEVKLIRSRDFKRNWENPDLRKQMVGNLKKAWTPERCAALSANNPSHDPAVNAKKSAALKGYKWPTSTCPHCGKEGMANIMPRWHFDNCKHKKV